MTDEFTKEGLAIDVDGRIRSPRVIEVLSRLVSERGAPKFLCSDNGPEFVSRKLLSWIVAQQIGIALIEPGKPWQNGVGQSFNGKFRDECLSLEWFRSRAEAKVVIESWRRHYNKERPHSSLGYLTPAAETAMSWTNGGGIGERIRTVDAGAPQLPQPFCHAGDKRWLLPARLLSRCGSVPPRRTGRPLQDCPRAGATQPEPECQSVMHSGVKRG